MDIYAAILGHAPLLLKLLLIVRNAIGEFKTGHTVGDTIGRWRIFFISDDEIIAGGDDKHQDFRVSVLRERDAGTASVVVTSNTPRSITRCAGAAAAASQRTSSGTASRRAR